MLWTTKNRVALILLFAILFLDLLSPVSAWRRRRRRRAPPPCPYVCSASNPPINSNPYGLDGSGANVCSGTAYRTEMYCTSCHCGSCPAYRTQGYSILQCCSGYRQSGNSCPTKIPCNGAPFVPHASYTPVQSSYAVGSKVTFTCDGHYTMSGSNVITCVVGPRWSPTQPTCNPTPCYSPPIPANAYVSPSQSRYAVGSSVNMLCKSGFRHTSGDATKVCQLGNRWTGAAIVCKPVCFGWIDSCQNGGICTSPNFCSNCKDGFHSPRCDPCPKITNCQLSVCSHPDPAGSVTCRTCMFDYGPKRGRAYLPSKDGKTCLKQCSWRADSNVCYPGTCGEVSTCKCAPGFTSPATQCRNIARKANFGAGSLKLEYGSKMAGQTSSINVSKVMVEGGIVYSNAEIILNIELENAASFLFRKPPSYAFIVRSTVGLEKYELQLKLSLHGSGTIPLLNLNPSMWESSGLLKSVHQVKEKVDVATKLKGKKLGSKDKIEFVVMTKNGGFVVVHNPENGRETKYPFLGQSSTQQMTVAIDRDRPQHCSMSGGCGTTQPLQLNAWFTKDPNVVVTWKGWSDALSGVGKIHLTVAEMTLGPDKHLTMGTGEHNYNFGKILTGATGSLKTKLPTDRSSVYEVKLVACDRVIETLKNCQPARRFFLFDHGTAVTKTSAPLGVTDQVFKADLFWLTKAGKPVQLKWKKHFTNAEFVRKGLLNAIKPESSVYQGTYEHNSGDRNISAIPNKLGITAFHMQYKKDSNKNLMKDPDPKAWSYVVLKENQTLSFEKLRYKDGDSLRYWVQASDPVGNRLVDSQTVHFDSTPPFIGNFSLSDRPDVRVVGFKELFKLKIRLRIYDRHSGIFSVDWQLYDNFLRTKLVHGKSNQGSQRYANLAACKAAHSAKSCYETNMADAYSEYFEIQLTKDGNLEPGMDMTEHDHDLQFKFNVRNNANLLSQSVFQISIDTTGPHPGVVLDGIEGQPEQDFKNSKDLKIAGHWKSFFDKESGIAFYKFKFGTSCFASKDFSLSDKTDETTAISASWTAPGPGLYHLTVVAYNNALQPSVPVCSDGLRIVSEPPLVPMVTVEGLRSVKGLWLGPDGQLWLLREDRRRVRVKAASATCKSSAAPKDKIDLGLVPELTIPHRPRPEVTLTDLECREMGAARSESSLAFNDLVNVSFAASDANAGLRSTEVVLRRPDGIELARESTGGHLSAAFSTAPLQHGARFHVVVRATSRAGLVTEANIGPIVVNERPPGVTGKLTAALEGGDVLVSWPAAAISDTVTPFPLIYRMSVENEAGAPLLMDKALLKFNSKCPQPSNHKPTCSLVEFSKLVAISGKNYYFALYIKNVAGHQARLRSGAFVWPDPKPKDGIVKFVDPATPPMHVRTAPVIIAQSSTTAIRVVWFGFHVAAASVTSAQLYVLESESKAKVAQRKVSLREGVELFDSLKLTNGKSYVAVFEIATPIGASKSESSPLWIHPKKQIYADVSVQAGDPCGSPKCSNVQASTSHLHLLWTPPAVLKGRAYRTKISLSRLEGSSWKFEAGTSLAASLQTNFTFTGLRLGPGRPYRATVAFMIGTVTSDEHPSQKVWIAATPPLPQKLTLTLPTPKQITLKFEKFLLSGYTVSQHDIYMKEYQWRISTNNGGIDWRPLTGLTAKGNELSGTVTLPANVSSVKCTTLAVRGVSRSELVASVERRVKACGSGPGTVRPGPVIDAKGPVKLPDTFVWSKEDVDYIKPSDRLSAVWPDLRYQSYTVGLLVFSAPDAPPFERATLKLRSPCDDKRAVHCTNSTKRGVNIPASVVLAVGKTYVVCVHADAAVVGTGSGREVLPDFSACSDGVTVLPEAAGKTGQVRMGPAFQSSANLLVVTWSAFFTDAFNLIPSQSIVKSYSFKIGTKPGLDNVVPITSVGLINQAVVSNLQLSNGEDYYATVEAVNVVDVKASASSPRVRIDLQAPRVTAASNLRIDGARHNFLSDASVLTLRWEGAFLDAESGICSYQWCVGTDSNFCDISPATITTATSVTTNLDKVLREGHRYYFNLRAVDCVGHSTLLSSAPYTFIKSGPEVTQVLDGMEKEDIDHQSSSMEISAHWSPFVDRFSDVVEYFVRIGSVPCGDNIMSNFSVGLHLNVTLNHLMLRVGVRYYMCVTGCNAAGRCSSSVSDGFVIDNSPPTAGSVRHGGQYQHSRRFVEFSLAGFADPESGLAAMEWSIGSASRDDVTSPVRSAFEPFVRARLTSDLPVQKLLFVFVSVWNNVGQKREAKSNGFIIDASPPKFSERPSFDPSRHSLKLNTQIAVSSLSLKWRAADPESGIALYRLSVFAHGSAAEAALPKVLRGFDISSYTLTHLKLRDGYRYKASVEVCNFAGLCTKMETEFEILVDSTPPHSGMFKPRTNASFVHEGPRDMKWSGRDVIVRYQGFSDAHSDVTGYVFSIGSSYLANDLLENKQVTHDKSALVQHSTFKLPKALKAGDRIFIALRAINGAGLKSHILPAAFEAHADGHLDHVRRCKADSCLGHCACAPLHHTCAPTNDCKDETNKAGRPTLSVSAKTTLTNPVSAPPVTTTTEPCYLAASWKTTGGSFKRFEVSAGLSALKDPSGIFDRVHERVWFDVGQDNWALLNFTQRHGKCMKENTRYKFFVRGWHDAKSFSKFFSGDVTVLASAPQVQRLAGTSVREVDPKHADRDLNFVGSSVTSVRIVWPKQFRARLPGSIASYSVGLGTSCGAGNVAAFSSVSASTTEKVFSGLRLRHGHRLVASVRCCDVNGLCSEACSNGVLADFTVPTTGLLLNTFSGLWNKCFQSNTTYLSASWKEFADAESFVSRYEWCIGRSATASDCSLQAWKSVGLHTHVRTKLDAAHTLPHAQSVFMRVRAANQVPNSLSPPVTGCGVVIDRTPPYLASGCTAMPGHVTNADFTQTTGAVIAFKNLTSSWWKGLKPIPPTGWKLSDPGPAVAIITTPFTDTDGKFVLLKTGGIWQSVSTVIGRPYVLIFHVADVGNWQGKAMRQGYVRVGSVLRQSFELQARLEEHRHIHWVRKLYYFRATEAKTRIEIGTLSSDVDGLGFDDVSLRECRASAAGLKAIHAEIEQVGEFSRIHASFSPHDDESDVAEVQWALGSVQGGVQFANYQRPVSSATSARTPLRRVPHGTNLHFSLLLINRAGLASLSHAPPQVVDQTPPVVQMLTSGTPCTDGCVLTSGKFQMTLAARDPESNIRYCSYALGSQRSGTDLQDFKTVKPVAGRKDVISNIEFETEPRNGRLVYPMVICLNERGVATTKNVNSGYRIVTLPPTSTHAQVNIVTPSTTYYPRTNPYQSQTDRIVFTWNGFFDSSGASMTYEFALVGPKGSPFTEEWRDLPGPNVRYFILHGLSFEPGKTYEVKVRAVNSAKLASKPVSKKVIIDSTAPLMKKDKIIVRRVSSSQFQVDWSAVFEDESPMYYEVAIGSGLGKTDVFGFIETGKTSLTLEKASLLQKYHMVLSAINSAGLFTQTFFKFQNFAIAA